MTATLQAPPQKVSGKLAAYQSTMDTLDAIAVESGMQLSAANGFSQAIAMANGIVQLREALTPEIMDAVFLPLMNTKLGFRTDKDPSRGYRGQPYTREEVRECLMEATLRGLPSVGNCWNIIAASTYVTKEGFWFLLRKHPQVTDLKINIGVPRMVDPAGDARNANKEEAKGALVTCYAVWKLNGQPDRTDREIPIRVNAMMGADAIMGKAERKILAAAYAQITGTTLGDADVEMDDIPAEPMRTANPPGGKPRAQRTAPTGAGFETAEKPTAEAPKEEKPADTSREAGSIVAYYDDCEVKRSKPDNPNPWVQHRIRFTLAGKSETYMVNNNEGLGEWIASREEGTRLRIWLSDKIITSAELAPEGGEG